MSHRIDQRLAQAVDGILVKAHPVEADDAHRVAGVAVDEGDGALDGQRHRATDVLVVPRIAVGFGAPIGVGQDAALGEDRRGVFGQQDDPGSRGVVFARGRVVPDQSAQRGARKEVSSESLVGLRLSAAAMSCARRQVEVSPADPVERAGLEERRWPRWSARQSDFRRWSARCRTVPAAASPAPRGLPSAVR